MGLSFIVLGELSGGEVSDFKSSWHTGGCFSGVKLLDFQGTESFNQVLGLIRVDIADWNTIKDHR